MKFIPISRKLNISILVASTLFLILVFVVLFSYSIKIEKEVYENIKYELRHDVGHKIDSKMRVGITNAISISNDERIKKGLKTNSRDEVILAIQNVSKSMKENTEFQNVGIHIHTKDNFSFIRSWNKEQYGDDLNLFRKSVVEVNKNKKSLITFETGREGLLLRAIVPIFDEYNNHLGSLEFIQGLNSVAKELLLEEKDFLLLMNENAKDSIKFFKDNEKLKQYIISQETINREFLTYANQIDIDKLLKDGYLTDSKYFYTFIEIKDFQNNNIGISIISKPLSIANQAINSAQELIFLVVGVVCLMIIVTSFIIIILFKRLVNNPLKKFETALNDFFLFLQSKKDYANDIDIRTNDEFGLMANSLKQNIEYSAKLHEELYDLNVNLEQKVYEKTEKITLLLNNAGQGFLTFKSDFKIDKEYSKECEKLLGEDIAFKDISKLLFSDINKQNFFTHALLNALNEEMLIKRNSYLSLLPNIILLNKKAVKLEYKIINETTFMLILTNVTTQKKLENKIKKEQEIFKMIVAIASESAIFYDLMSEYEEFINNKIDSSNINELYRKIHTFKGSFSQFYMEDIVKSLHDFESILSNMIKVGYLKEDELFELIEKYDFKTVFYETKRIIGEILGDEFLQLNKFIKIDISNVLDLEHKISKLLGEKDLITPECQAILCKIQDFSKHNLYALIKPYGFLVKKLAYRFNKDLNELIIEGNKEILVKEEMKPFIKSLVHVFRNSVDHGIETPDERVQKGKEEAGVIICQFKERNNKLYISISDDGMGLDSTKIGDIAINRGIDISSLNEEEIYKIIFYDNFSTKNAVSEVSGRGVGMGAVKNELEKLKGSINIISKKDIGTTFEFIIPL